MISNPAGGHIGGKTAVKGTSVCVGFPLWKRPHVKPFLHSISDSAIYADGSEAAVKRAKACNGRIITWASSEKEDLAPLAQAEGIDVIRMEDGFLRSVGLGSDFHLPYSLVLDKRGVYYDPSRPSDLEYILETGRFERQLLDRARRLRHQIISKDITKYNIGVTDADNFDLPSDKKIILVPGQVENDASVLRCLSEVNTDLKLLDAVRKANPKAFIIYKPHPDVLAGNRPGGASDEAALELCDMIAGNFSLAALARVDEVHTISSLMGFEALLRGKEVHTYGGPFYAGWGVTSDCLKFPRRTRKVTIDELTAAALILYPTYYDWETKRFCRPEAVLDRLTKYRMQSGSRGFSGLPVMRLARLFFAPYLKRWRQK
jgi:capsular polysaccharide export protein